MLKAIRAVGPRCGLPGLNGGRAMSPDREVQVHTVFRFEVRQTELPNLLALFLYLSDDMAVAYGFDRTAAEALSKKLAEEAQQMPKAN